MKIVEGDDWLGLSTVTGSPRCGRVVVVRGGELYSITGDCHDPEHSVGIHLQAALDALEKLGYPRYGGMINVKVERDHRNRFKPNREKWPPEDE